MRSVDRFFVHRRVTSMFQKKIATVSFWIFPTIVMTDFSGGIVSRRVMIEEACVIVACIDCHVQQVTVNEACLHVDAEDLLLHGALEDDSTSLLRSME
jgi:hypothetical protein